MAAALMWLMFTLGCFLAPQGEQCSAVVAPVFFQSQADCKAALDATMIALSESGVPFRWVRGGCLDTGRDA